MGAHFRCAELTPRGMRPVRRHPLLHIMNASRPGPRSGRLILVCTALLALALVGSACQSRTGASSSASTTLTIYSGRIESLVDPLLQQFARDTGTDIRVRYGDTAEMAAAILEEGAASPADVFFAQDAGALGAVGSRNLLVKLPDSVLNKVDARFRSPQGTWVGVSGRARVVVYNPQRIQESQLPDSILGFTDPAWRNRLGWAPTNGSFQAFVTAFRHSEGEEAARRWLEGIKANNPKSYANNIATVQAVAAGEVDAGFVNHYYLYAMQKDQGQINARNYHPRDGKVGAMMNVAGVGILASSKNQETARRFVEYMLSEPAQKHFTEQTFEYPLVAGVAPPQGAVPIAEIKAPNIDLGSLSDLDATLRLLRETGAL
jgi:iron(III) transport system substrate-binding protein